MCKHARTKSRCKMTRHSAFLLAASPSRRLHAGFGGTREVKKGPLLLLQRESPNSSVVIASYVLRIIHRKDSEIPEVSADVGGDISADPDYTRRNSFQRLTAIGRQISFFSSRSSPKR